MQKVLIMLICLPLLLVSGCSATISLPAQVAEPREVQLLLHGRHSSILLTAADWLRALGLKVEGNPVWGNWAA